MNTKKTSADISKLASEIMRNQDSTAEEKSLAASAMAQTNTDKQTSKAMETLASKIMKNANSSKSAKSLAASIVSQANKSR